MTLTETAQMGTDQVHSVCTAMAADAKAASKKLPLISTVAKNDFLRTAADDLMVACDQIVLANHKDLANAPGYGLTEAAIDRLRFDRKRLEEIALGLRQIAELPDPVNEVIETFRRPNGLTISKTRVPLGVVFFIYESRPNVTADAAAICLKSGNAVILRGGKEAIHSSQAIVGVLQNALKKCGLPEKAIQLVPTVDRQAVGLFLSFRDQIDVVIPRGGKGLIERVMAEATMPVIKHYDGVCHVYIDKAADLQMGLNIVENAKCQRMGVCNTMESLLVHADVAPEFLKELGKRLQPYDITYRCDNASIAYLPNATLATEEDWGTEYLGPAMSIKTVESIDEAIERIDKYGSAHSDCIVSDDYQAIEAFVAAVDSSAVMVNASTRFNDGGQFGFGAEIGISTDKFHARGPCGLKELTSYKYVVRGNGQIRE